jgi:ribosome-associated translation inhibitor RaiA
MTMTRIECRGGCAGEAVRAWMVRRLTRVLASLPVEPTSVRVAFADENGPKGGEAIHCALEVRMPRRVAVHVADVASTPHLAFDAALAKLERVLVRRREAVRESKRRTKKYFAARRSLAGG